MGSELPAVAGPPQPLVLEQKIPLGEVRGRIDHLGVDLPRQRLFVAKLAEATAWASWILSTANSCAGSAGSPSRRASPYDPASDTVFVADAGDGVVHRFTGAELTPLDPLRLGDDADNVRASRPRMLRWWSATARAPWP